LHRAKLGGAEPKNWVHLRALLQRRIATVQMLTLYAASRP